MHTIPENIQPHLVRGDRRLLSAAQAARYLNVSEKWLGMNLAPSVKQDGSFWDKDSSPLWYVDHLRQVLAFANTNNAEDLSFVPKWPCEEILIEWDLAAFYKELTTGDYRDSFKTIALPPRRDSWSLTEAQCYTRHKATWWGEGINPKVWLLVDELNRRNITTELSGDHYNNRVVMVHFPRRYQRWLRKAHLPAGWAIIYGSPASLDDYLVGQIKEHPRHRRFAYTCLIKKTAQIITGKEAAEVASAIDTALPASIKSPGGSQPAYKQGRFYYAVNWYDNKAPLAFRKRSARDLWVAINARCKALSVKDLMGEPYGLKRKNIPDKLTKVTWWQESGILDYPRYWHEEG